MIEKRARLRGTLVVVCRSGDNDNCSTFLATAPGVRSNSFAKTSKLVMPFFHNWMSLASSAQIQ